MNVLKNKSILFIAPSFHGLQNNILSEMIAMGAEVDYYDERPENTTTTKVLIRLKIKILIHHKIINYYNDVLNKTKHKKYNYVFILNMEAMPSIILEALRKQQNFAKFILFMWDSLELKNISSDILNVFDKAYTFDTYDAQTNNKMNFLPLFYSNEYAQIKKDKIQYDLCFIGTIHGDRYKLLQKIKKEANKLGLSTYYYMYIPSKIIFYVKKLFDKNFRKININEVRFVPMNMKNIVKVMAKSNTIIDLSYKGQQGLSMRTYEVIGAKKKLVTTHKQVINYDIYNSNNMYILDKNHISLKKDFFSNDYCELDKKIYEKYSLRKWVNNIFM